MDGHFRAFSFVDRVSAFEAGKRICGHYLIPQGPSVLPNSLVAEAIGQTAAWAAMAAVDFRRRPVAGLAQRVELLSEVRPGAKLEMTADLLSVDDDAVAYGGTASIDGRGIVRLTHCVGPMVPVEEFDSPESVRERFRLLLGAGAEPGAGGDVAPLELRGPETREDHTMVAELHAPEHADFYADHFPRRPVLPGTLLMDANLRLARRLMIETEDTSVPGHTWSPVEVKNVKLRAFIDPGAKLEIEARLKEWSGSAARVSVQTKKDGRSVGSAQVLLAERPES